MFSTKTRRVTVPIAIALAVMVGPALAGCSVQGIINSATGGKVNLGGKSVPSDFPHEVPLVKGTVVYGGSIKGDKNGQAWNVTIDVSGSNPMDGITSQMTGAGFTSTGGIGGTTADGGTAVFDSTKYGVIVVVGKNDNKYTANYTVTTKN